jgi:hypothetical protein
MFILFHIHGTAETHLTMSSWQPSIVGRNLAQTPSLAHESGASKFGCFTVISFGQANSRNVFPSTTVTARKQWNRLACLPKATVDATSKNDVQMPLQTAWVYRVRKQGSELLPVQVWNYPHLVSKSDHAMSNLGPGTSWSSSQLLRWGLRSRV